MANDDVKSTNDLIVEIDVKEDNGEFRKRQFPFNEFFRLFNKGEIEVRW